VSRYQLTRVWQRYITGSGDSDGLPRVSPGRLPPICRCWAACGRSTLLVSDVTGALFGARSPGPLGGLYWGIPWRRGTVRPLWRLRNTCHMLRKQSAKTGPARAARCAMGRDMPPRRQAGRPIAGGTQAGTAVNRMRHAVKAGCSTPSREAGAGGAPGRQEPANGRVSRVSRVSRSEPSRGRARHARVTRAALTDGTAGAASRSGMKPRTTTPTAGSWPCSPSGAATPIPANEARSCLPCSVYFALLIAPAPPG
jgi:hypothetical protein